MSIYRIEIYRNTWRAFFIRASSADAAWRYAYCFGTPKHGTPMPYEGPVDEALIWNAVTV